MSKSSQLAISTLGMIFSVIAYLAPPHGGFWNDTFPIILFFVNAIMFSVNMGRSEKIE